VAAVAAEMSDVDLLLFGFMGTGRLTTTAKFATTPSDAR